jgi:hypothetical protein
VADPKRLDFEKPERRSEKRKREREERGLPPKPPRPRGADLIPTLPPLEVDTQLIQRDPDQRAIACVNLRLQGAPFHEVAKELGYPTAAIAKSAFIAALAAMNPPEDWETLRQTEVMRAEAQLRRSTQMASAEYLVYTDDTGQERVVPNVDRLKWHEQVGKDLALHATISGAKAPAHVKVSADTQELDQLVAALLEQSGAKGDVEVDILALDEIEAEVIEED